MNTTDEVWTGDSHPSTTITEYKPNAAYICGEKDLTHCIWSADGCTTTAAPTPLPTPEDTTAKPTSAAAAPTTTTTTTTTLVDTESISRRGAMVALLVWLT